MTLVGLRKDVPGSKWRQVILLSCASLLAMTLWFSASAVVPQLTTLWNLTGPQKSWVTMSVQLGFVVGAILSALLNLPDRISSKSMFAASAFIAAFINAAIPLGNLGFHATLLLRFLTGLTLAGAYPPAMKLVATWCKDDRGLGIGILVGALSVGSAFPHLIASLAYVGGGTVGWKTLMLVTSGQAIVAGALVHFFFKPGPYLTLNAPFNWRFAGRLMASKPTRLANFGYLGHMWELYAMWTWVPVLLLECYQKNGWSPFAAKIMGFSVIAIGAISCVIAGKLADRIGRTRITIASLALSGLCAMVVGFVIDSPVLLSALCLVWGFAVIADSAQFSAAVSELTDPAYVGTALTLQTSLGFLLTLVTIQILPVMVDLLGWSYSLMLLAIGPIAGIVSMARLRQLPESVRMANGKR